MADGHDDLIESFSDRKYKNAINEMYSDNSIGVAHKANASSGYGNERTFVGWDGNVSIRSDFSRGDYEYFRPSERNPKLEAKKIEMSMMAYDNVGIVHNVIDLMADFSCSGIRIVHPNSAEERFFQEWWDHINGDYVSERFTNYLYRMANVIVNRTWAKIPASVEKQWSSTYGAKFEKSSQEKRRIPFRYNFLNPLSVEVIGGEFSCFTGVRRYALKLGSMIKVSYERMKAEYKNLKIDDYMEMLPDDIKKILNNKGTSNLVPLDEDNISVYYYKKDDWKIWATPMIHSIFKDIIELEKMKLADISALDGAISNIRLWRVGVIGDTPQTSILPSKAMLNKIRSIISNNVGGGVMDLVMGPEVDFKESNTQVHKFLGMEKYTPVLSNIYDGLGVPYNSGAGFNNNFIMMQTLVERLEYGRRVLTDFWNKEIKIVQKAMGFTKPAEIMFDMINLGDDAVYKKLLLDMCDRDIISNETLLTNFRLFSSAEKAKIRKEYKERKKLSVPDKASPYHNPQTEHDLAKIVLQGGMVAPSELGVELLPKKEGEKTINEDRTEMQVKVAKEGAKNNAEFAPKIPAGRPNSSKDSLKRKRRSEKPSAKANVEESSSFVNMFLWANSAQKDISTILTPAIVQGAFNKKNLRQLTTEETEKFEIISFKILCNMTPFSDIDDKLVYQILESNPKIPEEAIVSAKYLKGLFIKKNDRDPTIDEMRQIQASAVALLHQKVKTTEDEFNEEFLNG